MAFKASSIGGGRPYFSNACGSSRACFIFFKSNGCAFAHTFPRWLPIAVHTATRLLIVFAVTCSDKLIGGLLIWVRKSQYFSYIRAISFSLMKLVRSIGLCTSTSAYASSSGVSLTTGSGGSASGVLPSEGGSTGCTSQCRTKGGSADCPACTPAISPAISPARACTRCRTSCSRLSSCCCRFERPFSIKLRALFTRDSTDSQSPPAPCI